MHLPCPPPRALSPWRRQRTRTSRTRQRSAPRQPLNFPPRPFPPPIVSRLRSLLLPIDVPNHLHPDLFTLPGDEFFRLPRILFQLVRLIPRRLALCLRLLTDENQ